MDLVFKYYNGIVESWIRGQRSSLLPCRHNSNLEDKEAINSDSKFAQIYINDNDS